MVLNWIGEKCFQSIHRSNLVYNTCWEDPRLDREAMKLKSDDRVGDGSQKGDQGGSQNGAHQDGGERAVTGLT